MKKQLKLIFFFYLVLLSGVHAQENSAKDSNFKKNLEVSFQPEEGKSYNNIRNTINIHIERGEYEEAQNETKNLIFNNPIYYFNQAKKNKLRPQIQRYIDDYKIIKISNFSIGYSFIIEKKFNDFTEKNDNYSPILGDDVLTSRQRHQISLGEISEFDISHESKNRKGFNARFEKQLKPISFFASFKTFQLKDDIKLKFKVSDVPAIDVVVDTFIRLNDFPISEGFSINRQNFDFAVGVTTGNLLQFTDFIIIKPFVQLNFNINQVKYEWTEDIPFVQDEESRIKSNFDKMLMFGAGYGLRLHFSYYPRSYIFLSWQQNIDFKPPYHNNPPNQENPEFNSLLSTIFLNYNKIEKVNFIEVGIGYNFLKINKK